ncbi:acyl-CoA dehydrogenase family protein [Curtobacterium sp. PhB136]|uniref:acyl-CoA dehydrogenase family protein n=1 Tax=Curtobacterium sp. PhB136 TaxID=2485181 RepID=UPI001044CAD3|nr:acyl-CoA dehydrogenase family protein [Curtobacterium sp. PhB136]TCK65815.1 alkylation response protein AidB-like acyl-CoA dehydrogenase [Curtobacterium sp. PhB136]
MPADNRPSDPRETATGLIPFLTEYAPRHDAAGTISPEVLHRIQAEGMLRLGTPRAFGGTGADVVTAIDVCERLAAGCAATSWIVGIAYGGNLLASQMSDQVRAQIWAATPDAFVCGTANPAGTAVPIDGGWRLTGRWGWMSGINHAPWTLLGFLDDAGAAGPERRMALVSTASLEVEHTWAVAGMRGTGSDTAITDGIDIHEDQTISLEAMAAGEYRLLHPDQPRVIFHLSINLPLAGTVIGIAAAVLDAVIGRVRSGQRSSSPQHHLVAESPSHQLAIADAATRIDAARLLLRRAAADVDEAAAGGRLPEPRIRTRIRADVAFAVRTARQAVADLLDMAGSSSFADESTMQRAWRDIETASRHAAFSARTNQELHGAALLGVDLPNDPRI